MLWILLSLASAFFESIKDLFSKRSVRELDPLAVGWSFSLFSFPLTGLTLLFIQVFPWLAPSSTWVDAGFADVSASFYVLAGVGAIFNVSVLFVYMTALKNSDMSLSVPLITFSPFFLLFTSPIMLGEVARPLGWIGVTVIVVGAYILNIGRSSRGVFAPLAALWTRPGARLMLLAAFLWSITANIDKMGVLQSSPLLWILSVHLISVFLLLPVFLLKRKNPFRALQQKPLSMMAVGLAGGTSMIFQMTALEFALVAYVISIKRLSVVFSVLIGSVVFREGSLRSRAVGAIIMVAGLALISLLK